MTCKNSILINRKYASTMLSNIKTRNIHENEFLQSVTEIYDSLLPLFEEDNKYIRYFNVLSEPDRTIQFKIVWEDDNGNIKLNKGYRVQFNSALGPYKGGLRFNSSVNLSIMKFLGFEQIFKNALTDLPLGGAKGGSDFDPHGKSDGEIRRFCYEFMKELNKHIGCDTDIPAGDIGVGMRELGYLYGAYKQLNNTHDGAITGKGIIYGGSLLRPEATGYGLVYFLEHMLLDMNDSISGKKVIVSGAGNVATHTIDKLLTKGAIPVTVSDLSGILYVPDGINRNLYNKIYYLYSNRKLLNDIKDEYKKFGGIFIPTNVNQGESVWNNIDDLNLNNIDIALTCATQNEINENAAAKLINKNVKYIVEGSNMGCTNEAIKLFDNNNITYIAGKMANCGGVCVSQFEMQQNATKNKWSANDVDKKLQQVMKNVYESCKKTAQEYNVTITEGANILAFLKIVDGMKEQGYIW